MKFVSKAVLAEVDTALRTGDWKNEITAKHLVGLYVLLHERVYKVVPEDVDRRTEPTVTKLLRESFGGDAFALVEFQVWLWGREEGRERWRRENRKPGKRLGWWLAFGTEAVSDYKAYRAQKGLPPLPPAADEEENEAPAEAQTEPPRTFALTDLGNAKRFVARHGRRLRYTPATEWLVYDGARWAKNATGAVERLAKETVQAMLDEGVASNKAGVAGGADLVKHALRSQSARSISALLSLARSEEEVATTLDVFDADPMVLNCPNGTVDLRTGELRAHDPADLLTKMTAAPFDLEASSELWERVVAESAGDEEQAAFLQRALGYAATGSTEEEKLFMPIGPGGSGKSTILGTVSKVLGDYAMTADFDAFIQKKNGGGARNDIARLRSARLVLSIEVEEGKHLAEGLVKSLTGGDVVASRFLYEETFEFKPQLKLVLVCNDPPKVNDLDSGMWRRIVRIPFENAVPKEKRDPKVKTALLDTSFSGPAVLAWLVKGALEWQRLGLAVPESIERATEAYRESQDPLGDFFEEECVFRAGAQVSRSSLRKRYEAWSKEAGGRFLITPKTMTERLEKRGIALTKRRGEWRYIGVELAPEDDEERKPAPGTERRVARAHLRGSSAPGKKRREEAGGTRGAFSGDRAQSPQDRFHEGTLGKTVPPCPPPAPRLVAGGAE